MFSEVTSHMIYQILNTPIREYPFPHFFNTNVFPEAFYAEIIKNMPDEDAYQTMNEQGLVNISSDQVEKFERRTVISLNDDNIEAINKSKRGFWLEFNKNLISPEFLVPMIINFKPWVINQWGEDLDFSYRTDVSLFRDIEMWDLGSHTDQSDEILGMFIYLPPDDTTPYLGTSIYTPKEPGFTCEVGMRYNHELFNCVYTLPFLPNSVFGFFRNNTSFHGVECVKKTGDVRNLIGIQVIRN
jgi:hypothetical protein